MADERARASIAAAILRCLIFSAVFLACVRIGRALVELAATGDEGPRTRVAIAISGSALGQVLAMMLILAWLISTKRGLSWVGLTRTPSARALLAAAVIAIVWIALMWLGPLRGRGDFLELSLWRVSLALAAGLIAGTGEELMFRGTVIQSFAEARAPLWLQIVAGSLLFGLAHLGWAVIAGNVATGLAAALSTTISGLVLSALFIWSGRSLWPCILAHALINLLIEPWLALAAVEGFR